MEYSDNYKLGLSYLIYLIISADKIIEDSEIRGMESILRNDGVDPSEFQLFKTEIENKKEKEIYEMGIDLISTCSPEERIRAFGWLYKMSEVDGHLHVKEVRFLLYSIKHAGIEFEEVADFSKTLPDIDGL